MVINDTVSIELRRTGSTAIVILTAMKSSLEATVTFPELEAFTLYWADQVGQWRNSLVEITDHNRT